MFKLVKRILGGTILILVLVEVILRIAGFQTHKKAETKIVSQPGNSLVYHKSLGIGLNPGKYLVTINDSLKYKAFHLEDSTRITSIENRENHPIISVFGCSFTYGMGVSDEESFPYLLQQGLPDFNLKNFGVPGYSTVHALLQLQTEISAGEIPNKVIIGYSSYQDARNQMSGIQQKYWSESLLLNKVAGKEEASLPYLKLNRKQIHINYLAICKLQKRSKLSRHSVLAYRAENAWSNFIYGFTDKYLLTEMTMKEIKNLCDKHKIDLIIAALDTSPSANKLEKYCNENQIEFVDATLDIQNPRYNLYPHDSHPNSVAHSFYAKRILQHLNSTTNYPKPERSPE